MARDKTDTSHKISRQIDRKSFAGLGLATDARGVDLDIPVGGDIILALVQFWANVFDVGPE